MVCSSSEEPEIVLEVDDLRFNFRDQQNDTVQNVSFSLKARETLCLVGESGCGKSVTALSLMGLLDPAAVQISSGAFLIEGEQIAADDYRRLAKLRGNRVAMIFQEPMTSLNPSFRVGDQIAEAVKCHQHITGPEARQRALNALIAVGIPAPEQRLNEFPHQLSGGMRQRVMIAMALVNRPALLIADEPTTALDVTVQAQILDLIANLQQENGMATIMITHDLGVVAQMATTVAVMYAGQIVEYGGVEQIFNDPQHPYTLGLMSSVPKLSGPRNELATIPGLVPSLENMPKGCRFSNRCPFSAAICQERPLLSEISPNHKVACHYVPLELSQEAAE